MPRWTRGRGKNERTGAENEVACTAPRASQGPRRLCTESATTDKSIQGAVGCKKQCCHEGENGVGASASASVSSHSSDRIGKDDRDNGGSDGNSLND